MERPIDTWRARLVRVARVARDLRGWTLQEVAARAQLSERTVGAVLRGGGASADAVTRVLEAVTSDELAAELLSLPAQGWEERAAQILLPALVARFGEHE